MQFKVSDLWAVLKRRNELIQLLHFFYFTTNVRNKRNASYRGTYVNLY